MKFAKLIVIGLVLIGVSFSYASDQTKMLSKADWLAKNAWGLTSDKMDSAYAQYVSQYLYKLQKDHTVVPYKSRYLPNTGDNRSVMHQLIFPQSTNGTVKPLLPPSSAVASSSVASPASAASVVTPAAADFDNLSRLNLSRERGMEYVSYYPEAGTIAPSGSGDWYSVAASLVATDSAVSSPVSRPSVDTTREEGAGNGWFWSGQDADGASVGETDPELDSFDIMRMSGPKGRRPRTKFNSLDGILAGQDVSSEPTSLVFGDDMDNLVYLENALFDNNYEQLIAMTQAEKLALLQPSAGSEDLRAALLAELQNKVGPLRYSPSTSPRVVASGASIVVSDDGDDSDAFGDFIAAEPPRVEKAVNLVRLEEDLHILGVEYSVYSNQTLDDKLRSKTTLVEKDLEL